MYEITRATLYWDSVRNKEDLYDWIGDHRGIYALFRRYDGKLTLSYIGLSDKIKTRLGQQRIKMTSSFKVADIDVKNGYLTRKKLELIEHALIYSIQPSMNISKKKYPPKDNIAIINWNVTAYMKHRIEFRK